MGKIAPWLLKRLELKKALYFLVMLSACTGSHAEDANKDAQIIDAAVQKLSDIAALDVPLYQHTIK